MKGKYRPGIFVVVFAKTKKGIEYLILRRKLHWRGWEFPKGGLQGTEKVFKKIGVLREVKEETGLRVKKIKKFPIKGKYRYQKELKDRPSIIGQTFTLFAAEVEKGKVNLKKNKDAEHSAYEWANFSQALKKLTWPNQKKCLKVVDAWLKKVEN